MPQPMTMHTMPVSSSVRNSDSPFGESRSKGTSGRIHSAACFAPDVTMNDTLKPTPVRVTTPTTMPTAAAAASVAGQVRR